MRKHRKGREMTGEAESDLKLLKELLVEVEIDGQKYPVGQPSPGRYRGEDYGWDPAFFIHCLLAAGEADLAARMMDGNAKKIKLAGYLPLVTRWDRSQHSLAWKLRTHGDPRFSAETQQPLVAQTALRLVRELGRDHLGEERIRDWTEAAQTHLNWLKNNRRAPGRTLFSIIDPIESGEDSLSAWDQIAEEKGWAFLPRTVRIFWLPLKLTWNYWRLSWNLRRIMSHPGSVLIEPVSLNVFAIREALSLAALWRELGEDRLAKENQDLANQLTGAVEKELWNDRAGAYFPTARFNSGWRQMPIFSVENLYPLILPDWPVERIERLIDLIDEKFRPDAQHLLPVAPVDLSHPQKVWRVVPIWWPGQIWSNVEWLIRDGLDYQADRLDPPFTRAAIALSLTIDRDWGQLKETAGYAEFYSQDGTGGAEKQFFWSCLRRARFAVRIK